MSVSIVDQSTGNVSQVAGNANDKVGNLSSLTTTDKSSVISAINELNDISLHKNISIPNYGTRAILFESSNQESDDEYNGTMTKYGYIQGMVQLYGSAGSPFIRIIINNIMVFEYQTKLKDSYTYAWSPLFPVKPGDIVYVKLGSNGGGTNYRCLYMYDNI